MERRISVLISVYRSEKFENLHCALKSVWQEQTLKPHQIILIKDGLLDEKLENEIDSWKTILENHLTILSNPQNIGLTKSLNRGLAVVTGDLIARMDSDDIAMPDRFMKQVEYLENHPDVAIVGGCIQEFDKEHENLNVRIYPKDNDEVLKYIHRASPLAHPTVMMRREIFDKGLRYDERYRTSQDIALWFDVLMAGYKIANLNEVTLKFRRDGDVFKRRSHKKALNEFNIYMRGIYKLNGLFTYKYIFPMARLCFRMLPVGAIKFIYGSNIRRKFLQKA